MHSRPIAPAPALHVSCSSEWHCSVHQASIPQASGIDAGALLGPMLVAFLSAFYNLQTSFMEDPADASRPTTSAPGTPRGLLEPNLRPISSGLHQCHSVTHPDGLPPEDHTSSPSRYRTRPEKLLWRGPGYQEQPFNPRGTISVQGNANDQDPVSDPYTSPAMLAGAPRTTPPASSVASDGHAEGSSQLPSVLQNDSHHFFWSRPQMPQQNESAQGSLQQRNESAQGPVEQLEHAQHT